MSDVPRLFLIDTMPLLYRGHFAFMRNPRLTTDGTNVSGLFGLASTVVQLLESETPTHMALILDSRTPTFRHERYSEYKANRQKMPEDLAAAIPMAEEFGHAMNLPVIRCDGFEADDIIGTLARRGAAAGMQVYMVTPDKDAAQIIDERILLYRPGKASTAPEIIGIEGFRERWGLESPSQMIDLLGMAGDASDNIPGIPGVGEKTAVKLLQQFGSLEGLLAHTDQLKGKQKEKVEASFEQARLSRELAEIRCDVPVDVDLDSLSRREPQEEILGPFLEKYELNRISERLLGKGLDVLSSRQLKHLADVPHRYACVQTPQAVEALVERLRAAEAWVFDTETTGLDARAAKLVGISFCIEPHEAWYVPVPEEEAAAAALLDVFRPLFADAGTLKIGHNLKYDLTVLTTAGVEVAGPLQDSLLAHCVLDAAARHGMDQLARDLLEYEPIPIHALIGEKGKEQLTMRDLAPEEVADYAAEDADVTLQLHRILRPQVEEADAMRVLAECEEPLIQVLIDMESEGVRIDSGVLKAYSTELSQELMELERQVHDVAGGAFNVASPKQLGEVLFDRLQLAKRPKKTKSGQYATNEQILQGLVTKHPIIALILEHRACSKLKSTYVDKLPECVSPLTGRIHTTYSQAMTETGRLSSVDPNLQNIPVRTPRGRRIRQAFIPRDAEHVLISADYSQIELRIMAALSGDAGMRDAFAQGVDIHLETAARVYNVMTPFVTPEMRNKAKMVNFGIIYGISAFGLSQRLQVPRREAAKLIAAYFEQYPGVKRYMDATIESAREKGYVSTVLGRRRFLRDINSRNATSRQAAERNAINTPIQGSAADMIKLAMVRVRRALDDAGLQSRMVLQVHDELVFDARRDEVEVLRPLVEEAMVNALPLDVPMAVEIGVGENWLEAH